MRRNIFIPLLLWMLLSGSSPLHAEVVSQYFVFWYPGEAGTAAEAQPLLNQFAERLNTLTPGITWKTRYIPNESEGLRFIRGQKVAFGIVSYAMYLQHGNALRMVPIAATEPLPTGHPTETLTIVAGPTEETPAERFLFSSQPFPPTWASTAFPSLPSPWRNAPLRPTTDMRATLRQIAEGSGHAALLTPAEQISLKAIATPWAHALSEIARSQPIPTPPVVRFGPQPSTEAVRQALFTMSRDPSVRPLLEEMRLRGFVAPIDVRQP